MNLFGLIFIFFFFIFIVKAQECKDKDPNYCQKFSQAGYCTNERFSTVIATNCIASCGICKNADAPDVDHTTSSSAVLQFTDANLQQLQKYYNSESYASFGNGHQENNYETTQQSSFLVEDVEKGYETTQQTSFLASYVENPQMRLKSHGYKPRTLDRFPTFYIDAAPVENEELYKVTTVAATTIDYPREVLQPTEGYFYASSSGYDLPLHISPPGFHHDDFELQPTTPSPTPSSTINAQLVYEPREPYSKRLYKTYKPHSSSTVSSTPSYDFSMFSKDPKSSSAIIVPPTRPKNRKIYKNHWQKDLETLKNFETNYANFLTYGIGKESVRRAPMKKPMPKKSKLRHVSTSQQLEYNERKLRCCLEALPTKSKYWSQERRRRQPKFQGIKKRMKYPSHRKYWRVLKNGMATSYDCCRDEFGKLKFEGVV